MKLIPLRIEIRVEINLLLFVGNQFSKSPIDQEHNNNIILTKHNNSKSRDHLSSNQDLVHLKKLTILVIKAFQYQLVR